MLNKLFRFQTVFYISFFVLLLISNSAKAFARENISDWYIKQFDSEIVVNKDSSLLITEKITADCGNLPDKHGIFRVLPTKSKTPKKAFNTPIKLISITDFNDRPLEYKTTKDNFKNTITWKIGDKNITVTGENHYKIIYRVENAIRFDNSGFDELYWNLNGNFWEIETDNFASTIRLPNEVNSANSKIDYYTGSYGFKSKTLADYRWLDNHTLYFYSKSPFKVREGVTVSIAMSKGVFTPYKLKPWQIIGQYFWFLLPVVVFVFALIVWIKFGLDPRIYRTITPEFEIPENLHPSNMGMVMNYGRNLKTQFLTAAIINLAVKGTIKIEEIKQKWLLGKDYKLILVDKAASSLDGSDKIVLDVLFSSPEFKLSELRTSRGKIQAIEEKIRKQLIDQNIIVPKSSSIANMFILFGILLFIGGVIISSIGYLAMGGSILISGLILFPWGIFMPKRSPKGAGLFWRIKGFKLYMQTAERYRQRFHEKENIFEKLLPYAIVFGITKQWTKKMEVIYGKEYAARYAPAWYISSSGGDFNIDSLNSVVSSLSSSVGQASGTSGGGGAGGGGGGGGGGGW